MRVRATRLFAISGGGRRLAVNVFATAAAAYSMRIPANSAYTGSLARVRRSSDNLELDIGTAGAQVAQNRTFATASGWSLGTGVAYGSNQLTFTNATRIAGQDMGLVTGRSYRVCVVVNKTGAGPTSAMRLSTGNSASTETAPFTVIATNPPNGLNVFIGTITANGPCLVMGADTNLLSGSINFVSVQEATAIPGQNAWLNESALLAHVGVNSGFITTWYDQQGARNYTQTNTSAQPRIVNAGVLDTFNGKPTVFQNAAGQNLQNATFTKNINTVNAVFNVSASAVSLAGLVSSSNATPIIRRAITQANGWRANPSLNDYPNAATSRVNGSIASGTSDGVACVLNPLATPTVATFFPNATAGPMGPLFLFISPSTPAQLFSGSCPEVVYFTDQISDAVRVPLERSQAVAYGISIFDGAAAAYSLRIPFGSTYNGPLARVRRSNDNAVLDIGAVSTLDANGNRFIDTAALLAFTGSNSAFVTTLYDQSGNGRHATQTVEANQPRIVNAGVVDTFNSRPAMFNDGTRWLVTAGISALTTGPVTANGVGAPTTTQAYRYFQSIGDTFAGNVGWTIGTGAANNNFYASAPGIANSGGTLMTANTAFVMTAVHTGTASSGFVNGSASTGTGNSFTYNVGTAPITIGAFAAAGTGSAITGYIFEQVYFANTNIATAQRQTLERNQGAAYGITVA